MSEKIKKQIKKVLESHRDNLAFVIGNGINRYFSPDNCLSWERLIKDLYVQYVGTNDIPNKENNENELAVTFTELFDLIELQYYTKDESPFEIMLKRFDNDDSFKKTSNLTSKMELIASNPKIRKTPLSLKSISNLLETDETYQSLIATSRQWCEKNMEDAHNMTDSECLHSFMFNASSNTKISIYKNLIKKTVVQRFSSQKFSDEMSSFMDKIKAMNAPVLTTNYDSLMSNSLCLSFHKMGKDVTAFYPWNVYYSDREILNPSSGFGIWHINGMIKYFQSIKLGISDYMGNVERARRMIHSTDFNDLYNGIPGGRINQNWLHIIFTKNLFIFGLKLEENEVFLRWLLIQRAKYSKLYHRELKGWYVDTDIEAGKKFFLEKVGINTINLQDSQDFKNLYESF